MKNFRPLLLLLLFSVSQNVLAFQPIYGNDLHNDEKLRHYQFLTKNKRDDSDNLVRYEYIQRQGDPKPILFYTHQRAVYPWLSHHQRFVLISDNYSSELLMSLIFDFEKNKSYRIDQEALKDYLKRQKLKAYVSMDTSPIDISPDDNEVLIEVSLTPPAHRIANALKKYPDWFYAVDSTNGIILKSYQNSPVPDKWWNAGQ